MANNLGFTYTEASEILAQRITKETYVGLSSTVPNKYGANFTEPSKDKGYRRAAVGSVNTSISAQVANNDIIFIFEALEDCGSLTHVGLFKSAALTNTNPFLIAELTAPLTVPPGYVPLIRAKRLVIGLDKEALEAYD